MTASVTVTVGRFSSRVTSPSAQVSNLIRRTVPARSREYDPLAGVWVVYASKVPELLVALRAAGNDVVESAAGGVE